MKEDDVDVFVLRSLIALKLISKKELENFYKKLAEHNRFEEEARREKEASEKQPYYGA